MFNIHTQSFTLHLSQKQTITRVQGFILLYKRMNIEPFYLFWDHVLDSTFATIKVGPTLLWEQDNFSGHHQSSSLNSANLRGFSIDLEYTSLSMQNNVSS